MANIEAQMRSYRAQHAVVLACTACKMVVSSFNAIHTTCVGISHRLNVSLHHVTQRNLLEAWEEGVIVHRLHKNGRRNNVDSDAARSAGGLKRSKNRMRGLIVQFNCGRNDKRLYGTVDH